MFWEELKLLKILTWIGVSICIVLAVAACATALNKEQIKLETAKIEQHVAQIKLENEKRLYEVNQLELNYKQTLLDLLTKGVTKQVDNIKTITGPRRSLEEIKKDIETGNTLNEHIGE